MDDNTANGGGAEIERKANLLKKAEAAHAAFLRWQEIRRVQLGYVVNLVLTFTTVSLGFGVKLILDKPNLGSNWPFYCALYTLLIAVALGLGTNVSRLCDFRYTAKAARAREFKKKDAGEILKPEDEEKAKEYCWYRRQAKKFGCWTWWLLISQLLIFVVGIFLLVCGIRQYSKMLTYQVEGQIFRIDLDGHIQKPPGAAVHIFAVPEGSYIETGAEVKRLQRQMERDKANRAPETGYSDACLEIGGALQRQYAEGSEGLDRRLLFDDSGTSLLEEWEHINKRADFMRLSEADKKTTRRAFWLRRVIEGESLNDSQQQELWERVFNEEISQGTLPQKRDSGFLADIGRLLKEQHQQEGIVEYSDPDGRFSLNLQQGYYLLIAEGELPVRVFDGVLNDYRQKSVVWVRQIRVPQQSSIAVVEPFCKP
jgi:hypothetical protein